MKELYCFDFDGTITNKDTMLLFLKHYDSKKFFINFIIHLPLLIMMKLKLISAEKVKRSLIKSILRGASAEKLNNVAQVFFEKYHQRIIRKKALSFIQSMGSNIDGYIVTASLDIWVKPFADYFNFGLIATRAAYCEGSFTGNFLTPNCNGQEKVNRIKTEIDTKLYQKTSAFGDTSGDKPLLDWADISYFRLFH